MAKTERQSNIELLRIIAMLMIVGLHFWGFAKVSKGYVMTNSDNNLIFDIMESFCICGVNIFVLITGYFSSNTVTINFQKICSLLIDVAFWGTLGLIVSMFLWSESFDIVKWIKIVIPYFWKSRWFVEAYIILVVLIPFLNKCINTISKKSHLILIITLLLLFSIWPTFLPNPPIDDYGYGFIHFITLYVIAIWIRRYVAVGGVNVS